MANLDLWRGQNLGRSLLDSWEGFQRDFDRMFQEMENMLTPFRRAGGERGQMPLLIPACDVEERENEYRLSFDMPGIRKEDIDIEVSGDRLIVTGERRREEEEEKGTHHRLEREYGRFQRVMALPTGVDPDHIQARYENGVLQVDIPKTGEKKSHKIAIGEGLAQTAKAVEAGQGKKEEKREQTG